MANVHTPELKNENFNDEEIEMGSLEPSEGLKFIDGETKESNGTTFAAPTPMHPSMVLKLKLDKPTPALDESKVKEEEVDAEDDEENDEENTGKKKKRTVRKNQKKGPKATSIKETHKDSKKRSNTTVKADSTPHVSEVIADKIGALDALPVKSEGRLIHYLNNNTGPTPLPKAVKLTEMPVNSYIVIPGWRQINGHFGPSYILEVENEPSIAYWSNSRVNGIIGGGIINPETQVLTIHRLQDGSFIYGYADKK